jgi:hypothetical protein
MGIAQGVKEEIYYLMIIMKPDIFHIARCLETWFGLDIETWKVDTTQITFNSLAFEFSSEFNFISVARSDDTSSPLYTVVNVASSTPYNLAGLATTYVDSTASQMSVLGLKVAKKTQTFVLLLD